MLARFFIQYVLAAVFGVGVDVGYATVYGSPGDPHAPGDLACTHRPVPSDELLCAHRWLPCGTRILVTNLEHPGAALCRVADRGPYGTDRYGRWRGVIDLTPFAATSVHLDGRDVVRLLYRLPKPGSRAYENVSLLKAKPLRRSAPSM